MKKVQKSASPIGPNSLYRLGGIEILSLQQDEISNLWKIYLSTQEHYLVSREFDRSVGLYANANDDLIRQGLMEFSDSISGMELSLWKVIDLFIDRCFDENAFDGYTENAIWLSFDYPTYLQVENIIGMHNYRLRWFNEDTYIGELIKKATTKTLVGDDKRRLIEDIKSCMSENKITAIFMNHDPISEKLVTDIDFDDFPVFIGDFSDDGDFLKFDYLNR